MSDKSCKTVRCMAVDHVSLWEKDKTVPDLSLGVVDGYKISETFLFAARLWQGNKMVLLSKCLMPRNSLSVQVHFH